MKTLFPIVITLYNRPEHTKKLLDSLKKCLDSQKYKYYIFCDGPKNKNEKKKINQVRNLVKNFSKFFNVNFYFKKKNDGLVKNILNSIQFVMKNNDAAIVLEDD